MKEEMTSAQSKAMVETMGEMHKFMKNFQAKDNARRKKRKSPQHSNVVLLYFMSGGMLLTGTPPPIEDPGDND